MRRARRVASAVCACALTVSMASADQTGPLEAPLGGRPAALGHAYTALALDGYAAIWNPAGLPHLRAPQAAALHAAAWDGGPRQLMSVAFPLSARGGVGAAVDLSNASASYGASYGRKLGDRWSLGALGRYLEGRPEHGRPHGYAADFAALYRYDEKLSLGAVAANLGGRHEALRGPGALEAQARAGAGYSPTPWFTYALEGVYGRFGRAAVRTGLEIVALGVFSARLGVDSGVERSSALGLTAGLGLTLAGQSLDLSVVPRGKETIQQASLLLKFGRGAERASIPARASQSSLRPRRAPAVFHLPVSSASASGFISEAPDAEWRLPRQPEVPPKPELEETAPPGLIWLQ